MRYAIVLALLALSICPVPAFSQQAMKMGDKDWVALEKVLDDVNNQWLCAGKYYKAKRRDSDQGRNGRIAIGRCCEESGCRSRHWTQSPGIQADVGLR